MGQGGHSIIVSIMNIYCIYLYLYHPLYPQVGGAAAEAMRRRALAFKQYNQAALVAQVCSALPQFAGIYQTPKYFPNLQCKYFLINLAQAR